MTHPNTNTCPNCPPSGMGAPEAPPSGAGAIVALAAAGFLFWLLAPGR